MSTGPEEQRAADKYLPRAVSTPPYESIILFEEQLAQSHLI